MLAWIIKNTIPEYAPLEAEDMIYLGNDNEDKKNRLLGMLEVLFSKSLISKEKKRLLSDEYGIKMTETMKRRLDKMCNYSQGVLKSGYDSGYDNGDDDTSRLFSILIDLKRMDDLKKAAEDKDFRRMLMKELIPDTSEIVQKQEISNQCK